MKFWAGVTDNSWLCPPKHSEGGFEFLSKGNFDEVNF